MTTPRTLPSGLTHAAVLLGVVCVVGSPAVAQTPAAGKTTVACVGDSITEGAFVDPSVRWTSVLQADLGPRYDVQNFGVSGTTLIKNGDSPYWKTSALTNALSSKPNIVLIMLGTNDSKPQNLPAHPGQFQPDLKALIARFTALPTHPKVWLVLPPPVYADGLAGISEPVLSASVRPSIRTVARQTKCGVIDLVPALGTHPEDSRDHVHPNAAGHKIIGDTVAAALRPSKSAARKR